LINATSLVESWLLTVLEARKSIVSEDNRPVGVGPFVGCKIARCLYFFPFHFNHDSLRDVIVIEIEIVIVTVSPLSPISPETLQTTVRKTPVRDQVSMGSGHNVSIPISSAQFRPQLTCWKDPKLLYAINGINAYHIENGKEDCLTPAGPQTLSLLMVPTSSPFAGLPSADPQSQGPEEDFYLHLHLPPELDLPLPATTQIYHQPPESYLIPRWDLGPESGAFTRIEFPGVGKGKGSQEDVDTFETILAQCTAFLERATPPKGARKRRSKGGKDHIPAYDPSSFKPGEAYVPGSASSHTGGQIVLIDEEDGSVLGELGEGFHVVEDSKMQAGSKGRSNNPLSSDITNIAYRSRRNHPPTRRIARHRSSTCLRRLHGNGDASRLQKLNPRL
jgi:hypothetical protein